MTTDNHFTLDDLSSSSITLRGGEYAAAHGMIIENAGHADYIFYSPTIQSTILNHPLADLIKCMRLQYGDETVLEAFANNFGLPMFSLEGEDDGI